MQHTIEVTEEEYKAVMDLRSKKRSERQAKVLNLLILAVSYLQWMSATGIGDTYSTFCDDFGYNVKVGEDRSVMYKDVVSVIRHAHQLTDQELTPMTEEREFASVRQPSDYKEGGE